MSINKTTQYTTNPDSIPVNTPLGEKTTEEAFKERLIYVDSISDALALSTVDMDAGQQILVDGRLVFEFDGSALECVYGDFLSVAEMKTAPIREGSTVSTFSYYASDPDRGAGTYTALSGETADGYVTHDTLNGLVAVLTSELSVWNAGAKHFYNDGVNVGEDSTDAVQAALYFAKDSALGTTHTLSKLKTVHCNDGDFLISGTLKIPEGVVMDGGDKITSRLVMGWTTSTTKVIPWGHWDDTQNARPWGTTFTKNFGIKNLSFIPHYSEPGPSDTRVLDLIFTIEFMLHDVRFVLQKGAVGGGQLNATAIHMQKCIDSDWFNVTFDGGRDHIVAEVDAGQPTQWGCITSRATRLFSYNAKDNALRLDNDSDENTFDLRVHMPEQSGLNRGLFIESGQSNTVSVHAEGAQLRSGAIVRGTLNRVVASVKDASVSGTTIEGISNNVSAVLNNCGFVDTGVGSTVDTIYYKRGGGVSSLVVRDKSTSSVSTWQQVAQITFESGNPHTAFVTASAHGEVSGIGRELITNRFLVSQNSAGTVSITSDTAFANGTAIDLRVVGAGTNLANIEVQFTSGTAFNYDLTVQMQSDENARIAAV